jgi:hydrogenase expression/formation protein HypC
VRGARERLTVCLAIPARVVRVVAPDQALIDVGGVQKQVSLALVDDVAPGDYVIVHVGYALTRLDPAEAARTLALFAEAGVAAGAPP